MDYYFQAADDEAALNARNLKSGPTTESAFRSVEAKDIIACPHLEQLVEISLGKRRASLVPKLVTLWPVRLQPNDPAGYGPEPSIMRLPNELRNDLAEVSVSGDVAERWAAQMWGCTPERARAVAQALVHLAQSARDTRQCLYWWCEV
jgi:hypothetical protein